MDIYDYPINIINMKLEMPKLNINYPQVFELENIGIQDKINQHILETIYNMITEQGYYENAQTEITGTWQLKNNNNGILSLTLLNYSYSGGAHGITIVKGLTFNIKTGMSYKLKDLFKPDSNYIKVLTDIIKEQIAERNIFLVEDLNKIKINQDFYISDKCLVIFFQLYELTAYAYGIPYFPISVYKLKDIILDDGPLGKMLY